MQPGAEKRRRAAENQRVALQIIQPLRAAFALVKVRKVIGKVVLTTN
jgi:hypothetical protein